VTLSLKGSKLKKEVGKPVETTNANLEFDKQFEKFLSISLAQRSGKAPITIKEDPVCPVVTVTEPQVIIEAPTSPAPFDGAPLTNLAGFFNEKICNIPQEIETIQIVVTGGSVSSQESANDSPASVFDSLSDVSMAANLDPETLIAPKKASDMLSPLNSSQSGVKGVPPRNPDFLKLDDGKKKGLLRLRSPSAPGLVTGPNKGLSPFMIARIEKPRDSVASSHSKTNIFTSKSNTESSMNLASGSMDLRQSFSLKLKLGYSFPDIVRMSMQSLLHGGDKPAQHIEGSGLSSKHPQTPRFKRKGKLGASTILVEESGKKDSVTGRSSANIAVAGSLTNGRRSTMHDVPTGKHERFLSTLIKAKLSCK
jgi:hypothetical protein